MISLTGAIGMNTKMNRPFYRPAPLRWHTHKYEYQLIALEELLDFSTVHITSEQQAFSEKIKNISLDPDSEDDGYLAEFLAEDDKSINEIIPDLQYCGIFMLSYGVFEKILFDICGDSEILNDANLELSDFSGKGIEKAKIVLQKLGKCHNCFSSNDWGNIKKYNAIRNYCTHANGEITSLEAWRKAKEKYETMPGIELIENSKSNGGKIRVSMVFCKEFIDVSKRFILSLCKSLNAEYLKTRDSKAANLVSKFQPVHESDILQQLPT